MIFFFFITDFFLTSVFSYLMKFLVMNHNNIDGNIFHIY